METIPATLSGSSPLTRGKPHGAPPGTSVVGLIPAHAGKTPVAHEPSGGRWAHPRSRGENAAERDPYSDETGSSPLTRGKRLVELAGEVRGLAHPRSRGENTAIVPRGTTVRGSSPLTRGKLVATSVDAMSCGLIPAHAGKTTFSRKINGHVEAHPRSRGENTS